MNAILLAAGAWLIRSRIIANAVMAGTMLAGLLTMHVIHTDITGDGGIAIMIVLCAPRTLRCSLAYMPLTTIPGRAWF